MFTPAITAQGPRVTALPYASSLLSSAAQTTLMHHFQRDPPELLTNDRTCGYTSGVWSSAVTCGAGHSCTYYTTPYSAPNFGCCTNGAECGYVSTCVDYKAEGNPNTIGGFLLMDKGMYCGSAFPYCSTVLLYGTTYAPGSSYSFYSYGCLTESNPVVVAFQTTLDERAESTTPVSSTIAPTTAPASSSNASTSSSSSSTSESPQEFSASTSSLSKSNTAASTIASGNSSPASTGSVPTSSSPVSASTGLSQTSQIGIAVGASIGVSLLLAILAFVFWRHRKNKKDRKWLDQPAQSFHEPWSENKTLHPFDHRFSSLRSQSSGNSEAPFELASTVRSHELAASGRHELGSDGGRVEMASTGTRHELATSK